MGLHCVSPTEVTYETWWTLKVRPCTAVKPVPIPHGTRRLQPLPLNSPTHPCRRTVVFDEIHERTSHSWISLVFVAGLKGNINYQASNKIIHDLVTSYPGRLISTSANKYIVRFPSSFTPVQTFGHDRKAEHFLPDRKRSFRNGTTL